MKNIYLVMMLAGLSLTARAEDKKNSEKITVLPEAAAVITAIAPEFTLDLKNGAIAQEFLQKNAWFKEFKDTTAYEGLLTRISPVFFQLGESEKEGWKGKLLEFLYTQMLSAKPIRVQYFHKGKLASPLATTIADLGPAEKKIIETIVNLGNQHKGEKPSLIFMREGKQEKVTVTPVTVKYQKFAVRFHEDCFTISRDPVAASLASFSCPKKDEFKDDVKIRMYLKNGFPSLSAFGKKFLGLGDWLEAGLKWDGKKFEPSQARVNLEKNHLFGKSGGFQALSEAVPASVLFMASINIPDPGNLSEQDIAAYLKSDSTNLRKKNYLVATIVHLGMDRQEKSVVLDKSESGDANAVKRIVAMPLTAILVPAKEDGEKLYLNLSKLFTEKSLYEPRYRKVCGNFVAIAENEQAIVKIEEACAKKIPALKDLPSSLVGSLKSAESAVIFFQPGVWLSQSLQNGWKRLAGTQAPSAEITKTDNVLKQIPSLLYSGKVDGDKISFEGQL